MLLVEFFLTLMVFLGDVFGDDVRDFITAIRRMNYPAIERLAETVQVDSIDKKYSIAILNSAAHIGDAKIMKFLISKGWDKVINNVNQFGCTLLYSLCTKENQSENSTYEIMEVLLKAGANTDFGDFGIATGTAPLHTVKDGSIARLLISYGADMDAKNSMKRTPAHLSLNYKDSGVLRVLADAGANFSVADINGDTIFHSYQPDYGFPMTKEIAMLLARKGAPLEAVNHRGETPLTKFLKADVRIHERRDVLRNQVENNSDAIRDAVIDDLEYIADLSYENLNDSFYACMLAAGADINRPNRMGERLIHIAVREFEVDLVKWLLDNGADVDCKNSKGDTPLLVLLKFRETEFPLPGTTHPRQFSSRRSVTKLVVFIKAMMEVLVNGGADVKATDEAGLNAIHYLEKNNLTSVDNEMEDLLLKKH